MTRDQIAQAMMMQRRAQPPAQAAGALGSPFTPAPVPQAAPVMGTPVPRAPYEPDTGFQQGFKSASGVADDAFDPKAVAGLKKLYEDLFGTPGSQGSGAP